MYLEHICQTLCKYTTRKPLFHGIVYLYSFIQTRSFQGVHDWSKCFTENNRTVMFKSCDDCWFDKVAFPLNDLIYFDIDFITNTIHTFHTTNNFKNAQSTNLSSKFNFSTQFLRLFNSFQVILNSNFSMKRSK